MDHDSGPLFSLDLETQPALSRRLLRLIAPLAERALGLRQLAQVHARVARLDCDGPADFVRGCLRDLQIQVVASDGDLAKVARTGPLMVVCNHPFGGIEGLALAMLLTTVRPDVKVLANHLLGRIPELRELFILVDPFAGAGARGRNLAPLREATRWLAGGGALVVFPAGEVAHLNLARRRVEEPPWSTTVARLARRARCPVVPAFVPGRNRAVFQLAGLCHPALRTALLPRALLWRRGRELEVRFASSVSAARVEASSNDQELVASLRQRSQVLARRQPASKIGARASFLPRRTLPDQEAVAAEVDPDVLAAEVEALSSEQLLVDAEQQAVYVAEADQIPNLLVELGRLRELAFRAAGEGTGKALDLDRFDSHYLHLFVWNRDAKQVVGAYRLGQTDSIRAERGEAGLYTTTLFRFDRALFEAMGPALEMGRSFIREECQRSFSGLMLLWQGIGQYVLRNPRYAVLYGPVSISADYRSASQQMIAAFLRQNTYAHEWSQWVRPRRPFRSRRGRLAEHPDLIELSDLIGEIEGDRKGVPILLRQYLKLGGRALGLNLDPAFSNVLDVLVLVDLRRTEPRVLRRYMGGDGAAEFLASHQPPEVAGI